jgi:putative ABC transport system permease protein
MIVIKLALKEMLRNRFRFGVVAVIVALITLLVLLQVALAEGLTLSNSQYIAGIDADLMLFRDTAKKVITASNLGLSELKKFRHVAGVQAVGPIGFSTATVMLQQNGKIESFDVALIGVEPGAPGAPKVFAGAELADVRKSEVVLDQNVLDKVNIPVGSTISIQVVQGIDEEIYNLTVVGHTEGKKFALPSIFVPLQIWDKVKPAERRGGGSEIIYNVAAVKLENSANAPQVIDAYKQQIHDIDVTDLTTAYESLPGYREMQDIMTMMQGFVVMVAMLVIGVFFQIQVWRPCCSWVRLPVSLPCARC